MGRQSFYFRGISIGLVTLGLMAGAASAQQAPVPTKGGTAIMALGGEPSVINPVVNNATADKMTSCAVYEGLVSFNLSSNKYDPVLAESWTISPDGKTYTFKLRKANWHDGKPFTSEDVRYTLMEIAKKYGVLFAQAGDALDTVETPDPQTAVVKLKEPYGPFLGVLSCNGGGAILPAHLFKGTDVLKNPTNQLPVGTGAFKFSDWARGSHISLVRNDDYWDEGKPYLDGVIIRFIPTAGARTNVLLAGEVDYIPRTYFLASDAKTVEANPATKLEPTGFAPNMLYAFFNLKRKPLDDVKVRHALLTATDRKYIWQNAFYEFGRPGTAPWAKMIEWAANPAIDYETSHPFDPEKAGQMLEDAGYKADANGVRFKLSIVYDSAVAERHQAASALQAMWKRAGVELSLQPLEAAVLMLRAHKESDFDVYMSSYNSLGDPAIGVARAFVTASIGANFGNAAGYSNPEVDALFDKASKLTDLEARAEIYRQIQPILMRDLPAITLHENGGYDAASKKLKGIWGWLGNATWSNGWIDQK